VLPDNRPPHGQTQRRTFRQLFGLIKRNPFTISRWVLRWAVVGTVCGLFAGLYWSVLELMIHGLENFQGWSLLIIMPVAGLAIGLVIHFLGNPGEIAAIVDNIHLQNGRLDARKNPSMILASLLSISAGGSAGPETPLVHWALVTGHWSLVTGRCPCQQTAKYARIVSNYGSYSALIRNNFAFFSL
jgi:H+/Cl- antiporter ClcA